jgi:hypothetical protein
VLNERLLQSSNYSFRFDEEGFKTGDMDSMTMMVFDYWTSKRHNLKQIKASTSLNTIRTKIGHK